MPGFPASLLPDSVLTDMRGVMGATLTDTATVARTSVTVPCYLAADTKPFTIERGLRLHSYAFTCDYQADVQPGDLVTVGALSYAIQGTSTPRSQPVALDLVAIPTSLMLAAILAPEQATFQHPTDLTKTVPAVVFIHTVVDDVQMYGTTPAYPWIIVYESTTHYEGGGKIGENHRLLLPALFGTDGQGTSRAGIITKPRPLLHGLPFMLATVKEVAG